VIRGIELQALDQFFQPVFFFFDVAGTSNEHPEFPKFFIRTHSNPEVSKKVSRKPDAFRLAGVGARRGRSQRFACLGFARVYHLRALQSVGQLANRLGEGIGK
jgi:hypothetical protein